MVLKLNLSSMEQEFELNSLDENLKQQSQLDGLGCCDQRSVVDQQHLLQQQFPGVEMICPPVGSLAGGRRFEYNNHHHHQQPNHPQQQQFPPSPPLVAAAVPTDTNPAMQPDGRTNLLEESMMWLASQPLDLRSSDITEMDGWILRRGYDVLGHEPHLDHLQQQQPKINCYDSVQGSGSDDSLPDIPSSPLPDGGLNDDQLIQLSVRDLNRKLHGFPREVITRIKQKRRTLKNRGYAQNCRTKRIALKCLLEKNNLSLQMERDKLAREKEVERQLRETAIQERDRALQERDYYKQQLKHHLSAANHQSPLSMARSSSRDFGGSLSSTNASSPSSPEFYM